MLKAWLTADADSIRVWIYIFAAKFNWILRDVFHTYFMTEKASAQTNNGGTRILWPKPHMDTNVIFVCISPSSLKKSNYVCVCQYPNESFLYSKTTFSFYCLLFVA